jgi:membrane-associated phospholipid phosphatase
LLFKVYQEPEMTPEINKPFVLPLVALAPKDSTPRVSALRRALVRAQRNAAFHDVIILTFHALIWLRVAAAPAGPLKATAWCFASGLLALTCLTQLLCRGELLPAGRARGAIYRLLTIACVLLSYFEMRTVLPALQPVLLDAELLSLDEAALGITPAVWLQRFVSPGTVQWFAFFYYSYFWLLVLNIIGTAALDRRPQRRHELLLGAALVALAGHLLYTLVPGAGPWAHLGFAQELPDVFWWRQVRLVVDNAGAMLDIFPSLHTALPTLFALHAWRHRRTRPFCWTWVPAVFFAANIIIATLFLRWHYAVDVVAGLALAVTAQRIAVAVARRERWREASGLQPAFEEISARRPPHRA